LAATTDTIDVLQYLIIEHKQNPNKTGSNEALTPLIKAARNKAKNAVTFLLINGANVQQATKDGLTPLYSALSTFPLVKENMEELTFDIVQNLLNYGADIKVRSIWDQPPFYYAINFYQEKVVKYFIDKFGPEIFFDLLSPEELKAFKLHPPEKIADMLANIKQTFEYAITKFSGLEAKEKKQLFEDVTGQVYLRLSTDFSGPLPTLASEMRSASMAREILSQQASQKRRGHSKT